MRVYRVRMFDRTQQLEPVDQDYRTFESLGRGRPIAASWQCPPLQRLIYDKRRKLLFQDISGIGVRESYLLFSGAVTTVLKEACGVEEQWFNANFDERDYAILNLTHTIDASDHEKTTVHMRLDGTVGYVLSYTFIESAVNDQWIFKDSLHPYPTLCTDQFVDLIESNGFTGFYFDPVWDSALLPFLMSASQTEIETRPEVYGPKGFRPFYSEFWPPEWQEEAKAMKKRGEPVNY